MWGKIINERLTIMAALPPAVRPEQQADYALRIRKPGNFLRKLHPICV